MGHRYWSVLVTENTGSTEYVGADKFVGAARVGFREAGGVADLGGTPFASSYYGAGYEVANAFDGNAATRWASGNGVALPHRIGLDCLTPKDVTDLFWQTENNALAASTQSPQDFSIEWSDTGTGGPWTQAWPESGEVGWGPNETRQFSMPISDPDFQAMQAARIALLGGEEVDIAQVARIAAIGGADAKIAQLARLAVISGTAENQYTAAQVVRIAVLSPAVASGRRMSLM